MARTLPWARISTRSRPPSSARRRALSPPRSGTTRRDSDVSDGDGDSAGGDRRKRQKHNGAPAGSSSSTRFRTPSTSPPPAPPPEAYMVDGLENDDRYRMVEDELLAVAQSFTAHLHAAEYQRLKAKAKQHATAAGGSGLLPRPVTIAPTDRVRKRTEMAARRAKQQKALKLLDGRAGKGGDDSDDDDDDGGGGGGGGGHAPWAGTSLQSLMESSPRTARPALVSLAPVVSAGQQGPSRQLLKPRPLGGSSPLKTVTSAAMSEGETESDDDDDDDEDDLDGPPATKTPLKQESSRPQPPPMPHKTTPVGKKKTVLFAPTAKEIPPSPERTTPPDRSEDPAAEDSSMSDPDGGDLMDKIRKRREHEKAERQRRLQQQRASRRAG